MAGLFYAHTLQHGFGPSGVQFDGAAFFIQQSWLILKENLTSCSNNNEGVDFFPRSEELFDTPLYCFIVSSKTDRSTSGTAC